MRKQSGPTSKTTSGAALVGDKDNNDEKSKMLFIAPGKGVIEIQARPTLNRR
jgi:hypothetical protein